MNDKHSYRSYGSNYKKERGYKNAKNTRKTLIKSNGMPC